jgi:anti-sigma regulatory factor (Ser/Thr protein kinase)/biotin operon repressor
MTRVRTRGEDIRHFILQNVEHHPGSISRLAAQKFKISRQAINKHLQKLRAEHALTEAGNTRNRVYKLSPLVEWRKHYQISPELAEDAVWTNDVAPTIGEMPENVLDIWRYGFTELLNNAIDHSGGTSITVHISKTAATTEMLISDDGIGIFKKIQTALNLLDERHSVLELAKGKLTTDPEKHTGEGIFFTSRMFDSFDILSGGVFLTHTFGDSEDWIMEREKFASGTTVWMKLDNHTSRTEKKIFDQYASGDDYGFNKTVVPVKLAQYGSDKLVSRSQAKRVLARVELFKTVIFNFEGVETIGQAFADEIFRVFPRQHPEIEIHSANVNSAVKRMITRAKAGLVLMETPPPSPTTP